MDAIYEVHGLTKRYGRTAEGAEDGADFGVVKVPLLPQIVGGTTTDSQCNGTGSNQRGLELHR